MDAMKSGSAILTPILFQEELPGSPFIEGRRVRNNGVVVHALRKTRRWSQIIWINESRPVPGSCREMEKWRILRRAYVNSMRRDPLLLMRVVLVLMLMGLFIISRNLYAQGTQPQGNPSGGVPQSLQE